MAKELRFLKRQLIWIEVWIYGATRVLNDIEAELKEGNDQIP